MKKTLLMSTTIIIVTLLCVVPFSVRAASNTVWATGGNFDGGEGEYNVYTIQASSNSYLQFYFDDQFYSFDQYHTAVVTKIDLNGVYTGDITLTFGDISSYTAFPLFWVETGEGSCGVDGVNNTFVLHLNEVQHLTFYVCSTQTSTNNIQPTLVDADLVPYTSVMESLADYQIPLESLAGYVFAVENPNRIVYTDGDVYPHIRVAYADLGRNTSFPYLDPRSDAIHFIFMSEYNHTAREPLLEMNTSNTVTMYINSISPFTFTGYRIYDVVFTNSSTSAATNRIKWLRDADIYPIYYGKLSNMPENYRTMFGFGNVFQNIYASLQSIFVKVGDIYTYLKVGDSSTDNGTSEAIDDATGDLSDISGDINDITDAIDVDFNSHINDIDLDDHDFFTGLTTTTEFFKYYAGEFYTGLGDIKALLIVPIIVTIMMMIAGWMF